MSDSNKNYFKIATIGESEVGKTCIIRRYVENTYTTSHLATIGVDYLRKSIAMGNRIINLQIFDTAGQERFRNVTNQYFRNADGILLVFDLTSLVSFKKIETWIKEITTHVQIDEIGIVLIGNKLDQDGKREVSSDMGKETADKYKLKYFETSAKSGVNITESMEFLTNMIMKQKGLKDGNEGSSKLKDKDNGKRGCC